MAKRLTEKAQRPTEEHVRIFMGEDAWARLLRFKGMLRQHYELCREMKFPFGNADGWGFRYAHKKTLLLHVFFEENGFCCTVSINSASAPAVEARRESFRPALWQLWENRYPCGASGGWIHASIASEEELPDIVRLVGIKVPPKR